MSRQVARFDRILIRRPFGFGEYSWTDALAAIHKAGLNEFFMVSTHLDGKTWTGTKVELRRRIGPRSNDWLLVAVFGGRDRDESALNALHFLKAALDAGIFVCERTEDGTPFVRQNISIHWEDELPNWLRKPFEKERQAEQQEYDARRAAADAAAAHLEERRQQYRTVRELIENELPAGTLSLAPNFVEFSGRELHRGQIVVSQYRDDRTQYLVTDMGDTVPFTDPIQDVEKTLIELTARLGRRPSLADLSKERERLLEARRTKLGRLHRDAVLGVVETFLDLDLRERWTAPLDLPNALLPEIAVSWNVEHGDVIGSEGVSIYRCHSRGDESSFAIFCNGRTPMLPWKGNVGVLTPYLEFTRSLLSALR